MTKKVFLILVACILGLFVLIYLNRSYAFIYNKTKEVALLTPSDYENYFIGDSSLKLLTYVAIGDSLTSGVGVDTYTKSFPYILSQKISQNNTRVHLAPLALAGARSQYILDNLIEPAIKANPDVITLLIGTNDIHGNISEEEFHNTYEQILKKLTQETTAQIYIINLPFIGTKDLIKPPYQQYFDSQIQNFNIILTQLAQKYSTEYIDLYTPHSQYSTQEDFYSADLFHPGELGYSLWADIIYENINR